MKIDIKIFFRVLLLLSVFHFSALAQQEFGGIWKIDPQQSDFGGLAPGIAAPENIEANIKDSVLIFRTFKDRPTVREALAFGANAIESLPDGNTLKKAKVNWIKDKKNIRFDWYYEVGGNEWHYTRTETWNLSPDGKTLTIDRITTLPDKIDKVKAVYQKE